MRKNTNEKPSFPPAPWSAAPRAALAFIRESGKRLILRRSPSLVRKKTERRLAALASAVLLALAALPARAAFQLPLNSPQSAAMGGASLASAGDSAALFINPAAVAGLPSVESYFAYSQLYAGMSGVGSLGQGFLTLGVPTPAGSLAAGISDFQASGLLEERVAALTFAKRVADKIDAGVTAKYMYHRYLPGGQDAADPVFANGTSRGAFAMDAGAIATLSDRFKLGLAVRNINEPNVGLATLDRVPREVQAGLMYEVKPWSLRWTADYTYRDDPSGTWSDRSTPAIGVEKGFVDDHVLFRAGANLNQFTGGIGVKFGSMAFDYSFALSRTLMGSNMGTHQIGLRWRFGRGAEPKSEPASAVMPPAVPVSMGVR